MELMRISHSVEGCVEESQCRSRSGPENAIALAEEKERMPLENPLQATQKPEGTGEADSQPRGAGRGDVGSSSGSCAAGEGIAAGAERAGRVLGAERRRLAM